MKLSVEVLDYFRRELDKDIFITTIVPGIASMYPMQVWQQNLDLISREQEDPEAAEAVEFWANAHGATTQVDVQGRILVPMVLRQMLELDEEALVLVPARNRIDIYKQSQFEARQKELTDRVSEARKSLLTKGFS